MSVQRYQFVDSLRGMAILAVMFTHIGSITLGEAVGLPGLLRKVTNLGGMGVPLFYMISAFTIMLLFTKRRSSEPAPIRSFYIRRFMRIAPVYWAGIVGYTLMYGWTNSRGWLEAPELWHYPVHALFLNMTNPYTPSTVVPGGWSISNEMLFYGIFPALYFAAKTPRSSVILLLGCIIASPFFDQLASYLTSTVFSGSTPNEAKQFAYRWLPNQMSCFAAGFVLFHVFNRIQIIGKDGVSPPVKFGALSTVLTLPPVIIGFGSGPLHYNHLWTLWFLALAVCIIVFDWKLLSNTVFSWVGKVSFSCYIFHFAVIEVIYRHLPHATELQRFFEVSALAIPVTLSLAHLSFKYYETPVGRLTARVVASVQKSQSPSSAIGTSPGQ
ncbi:acyltransferase family protein [Stenotrophomonas geniculata]|uniref:acyltransferase family protein n=1 Tax=Stenotrophomonas geniculata TaxID=86188 RepID=UPI003AB0C445